MSWHSADAQEYVPTGREQERYWDERWNRSPEPNTWQLRRADKIMELLGTARQKQAVMYVRHPGSTNVINITVSPDLLAEPSVDRAFMMASNIAYLHVANFEQATGKLVNQVDNLPPAFQIQAPFTLRTASLYFGNLRDRWGPDFNLAMVKRTQIKERLNLEFRADALNVLNHPLFGGDPTLATTSPNFGKLLLNNGQTNEPRQVELSLRLVF